jgi:hypothetical protein
MTPEQLATLLARAVPEMRWTVDGLNVDADGDVISTHWRDAGPEGAGIVLSGDLGWRLVATHERDSGRLLSGRVVLDALTVAVADLLSEEDCTSWAAPLYARSQVLLAERTVTERAAAMKNAIEAWQEAVSALRVAQGRLEGVQEGLF